MRKNIDLTEDQKRELKRLALPSDKDLKTFIQDLLIIVVDLAANDHVRWLVNQVNKKQ